MDIVALGYIGVNATAPDDWSDYATGLLGMQQVDRAADTAAFRMDDRRQRLIVTRSGDGNPGFVGWEAADAAALDRLAARLSDACAPVEAAPRDLCDARFVAEMIRTSDPEGNRVEIFTGPMLADTPFQPGRPISGFRTGPFGMGHAVLTVEDAGALVPFYRDLLGFHVSDYGKTPQPLFFFHVNGRHHSFAMVGLGRRGFHHFMVEYNSLDDVGQGYDIALLDPDRIAYTMGRHSNDYMQSFYTHTPSGFFVESGFGGRVIDPETWEPHETFGGPSLWGHDRLFMPDDLRAQFREARMKLAREGVRAPNCPWLESVAGQRG
ncbi:MAG: VOC family protein [Rhodobacteraceae bacterium]|nr:VOC family protein [Paracoccaceae bacterium]